MKESNATSRWIVGISGASGAIYGTRLCEYLLQQSYEVHLVISDAGWRVLKEEHNWSMADREKELRLRVHADSHPGTLVYYSNRDIGASIASGSFITEGMVIVPCSMGTLASVTHGMSDNLLERAADVILKERRPLLIVPRETPLHSIHLQNMLTLSNMGAHIIPAMPGFYYKPQTIEEQIDFMVGKILDSMRIQHTLYKRWGEE